MVMFIMDNLNYYFFDTEMVKIRYNYCDFLSILILNVNNKWTDVKYYLILRLK